MGKWSRESQRRRRRYKKRKVALECAANESIPTSVLQSESTPIPPAASAQLTLSSPPGPRYGSPPSPTGSADVPSSLYSHGASLSPRESDTEARERTPRSHFYSHNDHRPTVTVSCESLMEELNETEKFPVIIHENKRKLEVVISDPEVSNLRGSEVLKLSMEEYIERLHAKEQKSKIVKCLRDRVESLQKKVSDVEQSSRIEKDKAVREVRKFWRNSILERGSHGGKMVNAALKRRGCN